LYSNSLAIRKMKNLIKEAFKKWKFYFLELMVVFIGVTSAFLLNTWWENQLDKNQANEYIKSIKLDLAEDHESLTENLEFLKNSTEKLKRFLYDQGDHWTDDSTMVVVSNSLQLVFFSGKTSTYESMKYSGHINLIRDFELRTALVSYYEGFSHIAFLDDLSQQWITGQLLELFLENMDMSKGIFLDTSIFGELTFINKYSGLLVLLDQNYRAYEQLLEENKKLTELLKR